MPIYVYEPTIFTQDEPVNNCCYFEKLQSLHENALTHCPTCGHAIHKAVTSFQIKNFGIDNPILKNSEEKVSSNSSAAQNAAQFASRHMCGIGCKH